MNVPPEAMHQLAIAARAPTELYAVGVVRTATQRLGEYEQALQLALRCFVDPDFHEYGQCITAIKKALGAR